MGRDEDNREAVRKAFEKKQADEDWKEAQKEADKAAKRAEEGKTYYGKRNK